MCARWNVSTYKHMYATHTYTITRIHSVLSKRAVVEFIGISTSNCRHSARCTHLTESLMPHLFFFFSLWFIYHTSILPPLLLILLFAVRYLRELSQLAVYFASAFLRLFAIYRVHWLRWSKAKRLLLLISIQLGRSNNQQPTITTITIYINTWPYFKR